jgi:hypothetical protein
MPDLCDLSKTSEIEIAKLIAKRDVLQYNIDVLDQLLNQIGEAKGYADATKPPLHQTIGELNNTKDDFSKLPWVSYATKQAAKPDEAGWVFANKKGAEELLSTLKTNNGKVSLGNFEYTLQGAEQTFIARKPVKENSA